MWVRVSDVAIWFGVSRATVYRAAARGEITIHRQRGSRVNSDEMDAWLRGDHPPITT
ncbi:helix-turn-helix domain-containing protein [Paenirhodobacter huangdaonensis]